MDLAIGRKPDYRPVGYMAHDEGRKSIKQTPSNKVRVISRGQGRGLAAGFGKVAICYSSESSRLAVKRSLSEHNKKAKIKLQQQELMENEAR